MEAVGVVFTLLCGVCLVIWYMLAFRVSFLSWKEYFLRASALLLILMGALALSIYFDVSGQTLNPNPAPTPPPCPAYASCNPLNTNP